ncbi:MAG: ABC transporter ATP-binding protein [Alistipes sp.]|nr:ABC transporter ATP-binding protein [Alistipes sp.]MBQ5352912.1 ABC transporter ATP-binding protein [Alistipes sp.]MBQ6583786.1 ABC transporter ATP-binding protein [Alistipes sp.]MBR2115634.1 ABC transporter ATP-binding protein [Alistipes sp.]
MIKASEIYKRFSTVEALSGVSLEVAKGEIVAIVGASGAGKSTLLQILGTLMPADSGSVQIAGTEVGTLSERQLAAFRNKHIGFVFQFHHLLPEFTAVENVMMPALIGGMDKGEAAKRAAELLDMVGLANRVSHKPVEMSGGEQQRVAIARALVCRPSVVLADEPTGNLDSTNRDEIQRLLMDVRERFDQTILMVTHDMSLAESVDRKIVMSDGRVL